MKQFAVETGKMVFVAAVIFLLYVYVGKSFADKTWASQVAPPVA